VSLRGRWIDVLRDAEEGEWLHDPETGEKVHVIHALANAIVELSDRLERLETED